MVRYGGGGSILIWHHTSELQNFNVEPNTQAIQDELIAQQQRYPQRFFYSIYLHDLVEGPGHPPRNGPAVPPPPVLPPGPAAGPSAASGSGTTAQATVSVPLQEEVVDPLAAGLQMEVGIWQTNDQVGVQPLPVIEADEQLEAILSLGDGNVQAPMLDPDYLVGEQPLPVIEADEQLEAILSLGDGNVQAPMLDPDYLVGEQPLPVIEADEQLEAILSLGDGNVPAPLLDPQFLADPFGADI